MAQSEAPIAQVHDLCFSFPHRMLFQNWSARIPAGLTCIQGDESSGKTTLLRLLAADLPVQSGHLEIAGLGLDSDDAGYRAQVFRTDPKVELPQQITPIAWLDSLRGRYRHFNGAAIADLIERLSLGAHQHKPMYMLSTGSQRKVWLAAAFACGAPLTLIDQPFAALDKASITAVADLLREAGQESDRAWVVADYEAPFKLHWLQTISLD